MFFLAGRRWIIRSALDYHISKTRSITEQRKIHIFLGVGFKKPPEQTAVQEIWNPGGLESRVVQAVRWPRGPGGSPGGLGFRRSRVSGQPEALPWPQ